MIAPREPTEESLSVPQHIREFVYQTLCQTNQLEVGFFPMREAVFVRKGRPCGFLFCLFGPRLTRFMAIWDLHQQNVVFYNAAGQRYLIMRAPSDEKPEE